MFDLPTDTKKARKEYTIFRKHLLEDGFTKMQFSVYTRFVNGTEHMEKHVLRVQKFLPPGGEVRILCFTDKQFERMHVFFGKLRIKEKNPWQQLTFF
jgi:CRISPR-associated protein Cas2